MSNKKDRKFNLWLIIGGVILIVIVLIFGLGLYPMAMVGSTIVTKSEFKKNLSLAKRFNANPNQSNIFNLLLEEKQKEQLLNKYRINRSQTVVDELKYYKTGNTDQYNDLLRKYFSNSEKLFVDFVVERQAYDAALRIKYNSDFGANNNTYNKADNILKRLLNGESFEELAVLSDDKTSGQLGGDLGFVSSGQVLPELEKVISTSTMGEIKKEIVVSRLGYHILYPVEVAERNGEQVWHVRHILVQTMGYEQWLDQQLKTIGVKKFTKL